MINTIIFSKDRAAQLGFPLRSMRKHWKDMGQNNIRVIYTTSDPEFDQGYDMLMREHSDIVYIRELNGGFRETLIASINEKQPLTMFFTDDDVFVHDFTTHCRQVKDLLDNDELLTVALRLRPGLRYCYAYQRPMRPPEFRKGVWRWDGAEGDYGYPMSLDGGIFRTTDMMGLLNQLQFKNPNQLEGAMAGAPPLRMKASCFDYQVIINLPYNKVQTENQNHHMGHDPAEFNRSYLCGKRLSFSALKKPGSAVHCEVQAIWE